MRSHSTRRQTRLVSRIRARDDPPIPGLRRPGICDLYDSSAGALGIGAVHHRVGNIS